MKKYIYIFSFIVLTFLLASCDSSSITQPGAFFDHIGQSFNWFFANLTPKYFSSLKNIWEMLSALKSLWDIPSIIGVVVGVLMSVIVFAILLLISVLIIVGYVLLLVLFIGIFAILLILALLGALISAISIGILSN